MPLFGHDALHAPTQPRRWRRRRGGRPARVREGRLDRVRSAFERACARSCGCCCGENHDMVCAPAATPRHAHDETCRFVDAVYELRDSGAPDATLLHVSLEAFAHAFDARLTRRRLEALALTPGLAADARPKLVAASPLRASHSAEDDLRDPQWVREEYGLLFSAAPPTDEERDRDVYLGYRRPRDEGDWRRICQRFDEPLRSEAGVPHEPRVWEEAWDFPECL
jgi:hypothetical protein